MTGTHYDIIRQSFPIGVTNVLFARYNNNGVAVTDRSSCSDRRHGSRDIIPIPLFRTHKRQDTFCPSLCVDGQPSIRGARRIIYRAV